MDKTRPSPPKQEPPARPPAGKKAPWLSREPFAAAGLGLGVLQLVLLALVLGNLKSGSPPPSSPESVPVAALRTDLAGLRNDPRLTRLEEKLSKLQESVASLKAPQRQTGAAAGTLCPQLDVMVLALNSRNLTLADYKESFKGLFADYARERPFWAPTGNYRLGFYVAQTEQVDARVALNDPSIKLTSFNIGAPGNHITERLSAIGPRVLAQFNKDRPNRRCLVVASAQCPPPEPGDPGWKDLAAVDAILIGAAPAADLAEKWKSFCGRKKGEAVFLLCGTRPDRAVILELRLLLRSLAHPVRGRP